MNYVSHKIGYTSCSCCEEGEYRMLIHIPTFNEVATFADASSDGSEECGELPLFGQQKNLEHLLGLTVLCTFVILKL